MLTAKLSMVMMGHQTRKEFEMGISAKMVATMMMQAGMGENSVIAAFNILKPIAKFDNAPYYCPTKVSRYIKKHAI